MLSASSSPAANGNASLALLIYPALVNQPVSDTCEEKRHGQSGCPTLVAALLKEWHREGVAAILPLDNHAERHLPPVVLHVLRDEPKQAALFAKADPDLFHRYLPSLIATAPLDSLRAALHAAPPSEASLLTPTGGDTQYQHLSSLFDAAGQRDAGQPSWDSLWLLFDLFPQHLDEVDTDLYDHYVIGPEPGDPNLAELLTRLRVAGLDCEKFRSLVSWNTKLDSGRQWFSQKSGCRWSASH